MYGFMNFIFDMYMSWAEGREQEKKSRNIVTSLHPVLMCVWCHLTLARATSAHVCGTSVVLGPWYSVRVLIQYSVITFRATSMADTDIDAINKTTYNFYLVIEVPDHVYVLVRKI